MITDPTCTTSEPDGATQEEFPPEEKEDAVLVALLEET